MRFLMVADLHYSLPQYDWVTEVAGNFDMVVIAGDHLDTGSLVDIGAQIVVIRKYLERLSQKTMVLVCSGNHDLDVTEAGEKVTRWILGAHSETLRTDSESFRFGEALFTICPWWDGAATRDGIGRQLAADAPQRGYPWVWVHHAPPDKSPIAWGGSRFYGDVELAQWIGEYKPDMVLCGHVHQAPFTPAGSWVDRIGDTWVFNAGHQFGAPPAHIVIDTEQAMALWFSAAGNQFVHLDRPLEGRPAKLTELPQWLRGEDQTAGPIPA